MSEFARLEEANAAHVAAGGTHDVPARPARGLVVVTCMDARIEVPSQLGIEPGQAHVVRTAGGRVTDDVLRSLTLSTWLLGTRHVAVITHTHCGLQDPAGDLATRVAEAAGRRLEPRDWGGFVDPGEAARADAQRVREWPELPPDVTVAAYVLDVEGGRLRRVPDDHDGDVP